MADTPPEIIDHYRCIDEDARIRNGIGQLELLRTQSIVRRFLPPGPQRIVDVGGATGVHASWLAKDGHQVQIYDVVPEHVETSRLLAVESPTISAALGDARQLPDADDSFDAALLCGPLYHLTGREDRVLALNEARRVVRTGGFIFGAAISRFASLFDGLEKGFLFDEEGVRMVEVDLATGQHRNNTNDPRWFTTAYFHRPDELRQEFLDANLDVVTVIGIEGLAGWLPHLADSWRLPERRKAIERAAAMVESEESLIGLSPHLLAVAQVG
ncbi:MAG: methyltransferase domain-containing protein [Actinomycetes bacterium]